MLFPYHPNRMGQLGFLVPYWFLCYYELNAVHIAEDSFEGFSCLDCHHELGIVHRLADYHVVV